MVRLATLLKKYRAGIEDLSPDGLNTEQQLMAIRGRALTMMGSLSRCWNESLRPLLAAEGVHFLDVADFTPAINEYLAQLLPHRHLPGPDAAGVRPRPSVPLHLEPEQEPRGGREARRADQVRARQGAGHAAALRAGAREHRAARAA